MAAPASTVRGTPAGIPLWDGFSSKIAPAWNATVSFWEITVQPFKLSMGQPIPRDTMHNVRYRMKAPGKLVDVGVVKLKVAYDPNLLNQIYAFGGVEGAWTQTYPDGSKNDFYGFLNDFDPEPLEDQKRPEATIEIVVTNYDPTNHLEVGPVTTSAPGT